LVKNPEDFLENIDNFLDKTKTAKPVADAKPQPDKQAGEGPQLQLNLSDAGVNTAIGAAVNKNWTIPRARTSAASASPCKSPCRQTASSPSFNVSQSSGDKSFDDSLVRAIRQVHPAYRFRRIKMSEYSDFEMAFGQNKPIHAAKTARFAIQNRCHRPLPYVSFHHS